MITCCLLGKGIPHSPLHYSRVLYTNNSPLITKARVILDTIFVSEITFNAQNVGKLVSFVIQRHVVRSVCKGVSEGSVPTSSNPKREADLSEKPVFV